MQNKKKLLLGISLFGLCGCQLRTSEAPPQHTNYASFDSRERQQIQLKNPEIIQKIDCRQELSIEDIKTLNRLKIHEKTIIHLIAKTNSRYNLTTAQVIELKNDGVSQRVIDFMINNT
ncbi:MAG: hypothetical protein WDZ28_03765 [Simkaniaceae bacterium]